MTYGDIYMLFCFTNLITHMISGEWIELPKLSRQNILTTFPTVLLQDEKTTLANLLEITSLTPSTTQSTIGSENKFTEEDNDQSYPYTNKSYTFLDPKLEAVLIKVHQILVEEGRHPIKHKMRFLRQLQNNILGQIRRKAQSLWTPENLEARGHGNMMKFPSLEGALMTISFLTFAVFLIKLVKQFIQGLQGANGNMIGIDIPGTPAPTKIKTRPKRSISIDELEVQNILNYINKLTTQHRP